jgi:hypothetical protein
MTCHRCSGLLVNDHSFAESLDDLSVVPGCMGLTVRCINCGYLEDPVVRTNRLRQPAATPPPAPLGARESSLRKSLMLCIRVSQPIQRRCSP